MEIIAAFNNYARELGGVTELVTRWALPVMFVLMFSSCMYSERKHARLEAERRRDQRRMR